ncbi:hypothetical protein RI129_001207 [Pyrocoelia pectoralis]|uniref:Fcf2 pre-rRNA processing C-terminal domain-containing protein n=1 Tax=Pyrocoelia pectoralis TaxID=417401 RepID=A0AAN7VUX8_9COLE
MSFFIDTGNPGNIQDEEILLEYKTSLQSSKCKAKNENIFEKFSIEMEWTDKALEKKKQKQDVDVIDTIQTKRKVDDLLKKSVLTSEFENLKQVPPYEVAERRLKLERKKERAKTKGAKWYGLPATELTKEVKDDLQILQMRSVLDPKRFYKKNDLSVLPKYFQVGKVLDSPLEFYNNRLTKKEKKKSLVDELLADAEFNKYNKKRYREIIEEKRSKAWKQAKKRNRNKSKTK